MVPRRMRSVSLCDGGEVDAGRGDVGAGPVLVLDREVGVPAELLQLLRQVDVLLVHVGHGLAFLRSLRDRIPEREIQLAHISPPKR